MRLVILVGLPASGKSTWLKRNRLPALSSDDVRELLTGDPTNQSINRLVFRTLRQLAQARGRRRGGGHLYRLDGANSLGTQVLDPVCATARVARGGHLLRHSAGGMPAPECPAGASGARRDPDADGGETDSAGRRGGVPAGGAALAGWLALYNGINETRRAGAAGAQGLSPGRRNRSPHHPPPRHKVRALSRSVLSGVVDVALAPLPRPSKPMIMRNLLPSLTSTSSGLTRVWRGFSGPLVPR